MIVILFSASESFVDDGISNEINNMNVEYNIYSGFLISHHNNNTIMDHGILYGEKARERNKPENKKRKVLES